MQTEENISLSRSLPTTTLTAIPGAQEGPGFGHEMPLGKLLFPLGHGQNYSFAARASVAWV